jgi:hypothetical protein
MYACVNVKVTVLTSGGNSTFVRVGQRTAGK